MVGSQGLLRGALAWEQSDRPPVLFTGGMWAGRLSGFSRDRLLDDASALAEAQWRVHELIGQDALLAYFDPLFIPEAYGCELRFLETGPLVAPIPLTRFADQAPSVGDGRLPVVLEAVACMAARAGGRIPVGTLVEGPFTTLSRIADAEVLLRLTITDAAAVDAALGRMTEMLLAFCRAAAEAGADFVFVADPVASATMISPAMFGRFALPALRELCAGLSIPVILHICGDTTPILADMAGSGAAALSLDQCMDLREARRRIDGRCVLAGNLDPMTLLMGTPEEVARETRRVMEAGGNRGFILMPGCGVPPGAPFQKVAAMVRAAREG